MRSTLLTADRLRAFALAILCVASALALAAPADAAPSRKPGTSKARRPAAGRHAAAHPPAPAPSATLDPPTVPAFSLPIDKTTLPNGLRVVLQPDKSSSAIGVAVVFSAGPRHESKNQQGFSAAVARVLSEAPATLAPDRVRELTLRGGSLSTSSTPDLVAFVDLVPPGALDFTLWLESRRAAVSSFPATVVEAMRSSQQGFDRLLPVPGQLGPATPPLARMAFEGFWPYEHDASAVDASASPETLRDFHHAWFGAENAAVCVSGAIDPDAARALVERHFGQLPRNPQPPAFNPAPLPDQTNQRSAVVRTESPRPLMALGWAVPSARQPEHDALELAASILGEGPESRLAQRMSHARSPASFAVEIDERRGPSLFTISLQAADDAALLAARKLVDEELDALARLGPSSDEMLRGWRSAQSGFLRGLQRPEERALRLASLELLHGDARLVHAELARRMSAGKDDVRKAVARFLSPTRRSVVEANAAGRSVETPPPAPVPAAAAPRPAPAAATLPRGKAPAHKKPPASAPKKPAKPKKR
ncbi:MAG TPA: pitrilysin family protein [Polyangiaceae bacterium]|nr:pitrilysin family protein [Polyangiaceae bacterium]